MTRMDSLAVVGEEASVIFIYSIESLGVLILAVARLEF